MESIYVLKILENNRPAEIGTFDDGKMVYLTLDIADYNKRTIHFETADLIRVMSGDFNGCNHYNYSPDKIVGTVEFFLNPLNSLAIIVHEKDEVKTYSFDFDELKKAIKFITYDKSVNKFDLTMYDKLKDEDKIYRHFHGGYLYPDHFYIEYSYPDTYYYFSIPCDISKDGEFEKIVKLLVDFDPRDKKNELYKYLVKTNSYNCCD